MTDVVVIGAGMAGIRVATLRAAAGDRVTIVDKGRRLGGRMATRRIDEATFDTGVLDLAAYGPSFIAELSRWMDDGAVARTPDRWRGRPTARSLPTELAERSGARVLLATTVTALTTSDGRWRLTLRSDEGPTTMDADALAVTAPAPQSAALLRTEKGLVSATTLDALDAVRYESTLSVLVRPVDRTLLTGELRTPTAEALRATDIARLHRNDTTRTSSVVALTLHGRTAWSAAALNGDRDTAARELTAQASGLVGTTLEVVHVHGWRYAQVAHGIDVPALRDDASGVPLVLAGDAFEARGDAPPGVRPEGVERAFVSGGAAARLLDDHGPGHGEGP